MFAWADYLSLAQALAQSKDEASQRTAISRAYYAAFHVARRHVAQTHPEVTLPRHGAVHDVVWTTLERGAREERAAAHGGKRLRQKRTLADYEMLGLSFPSDTQQAVAWAEGVIRSLAALEKKTG
jgi:uncharacterized protein (UPF0332 family)